MKEKRKTWSDLKKFIDKLTPKQLKQEIVFQDDYGAIKPINFYIQGYRAINDPVWGTEVKEGMPYFGI